MEAGGDLKGVNGAVSRLTPGGVLALAKVLNVELGNELMGLPMLPDLTMLLDNLRNGNG